MKPAFPAVLVLLFISACQGPAADDATLCQDVIQRLCSNPRCEAVTQTLLVDDTCTEQLQQRTGCGNADFVFGENNAPSRDRFLECRVPLLRAGDERTTAPHCEDVSESFDRCDDLVRFLKGEAS